MATRRPFQPSWVQSKSRKLKLRLWRSRLKLLKKFKLVWRVKLKKQTPKKQLWMRRQVMSLKILKPFWNNIRFVTWLTSDHFDQFKSFYTFGLFLILSVISAGFHRLVDFGLGGQDVSFSVDYGHFWLWWNFCHFGLFLAVLDHFFLLWPIFSYILLFRFFNVYYDFSHFWLNRIKPIFVNFVQNFTLESSDIEWPQSIVG